MLAAGTARAARQQLTPGAPTAPKSLPPAELAAATNRSGGGAAPPASCICGTAAVAEMQALLAGMWRDGLTALAALTALAVLGACSAAAQRVLKLSACLHPRGLRCAHFAVLLLPLPCVSCKTCRSHGAAAVLPRGLHDHAS
jgi:hypothetical protein